MGGGGVGSSVSLVESHQGGKGPMVKADDGRSQLLFWFEYIFANAFHVIPNLNYLLWKNFPLYK